MYRNTGKLRGNSQGRVAWPGTRRIRAEEGISVRPRIVAVVDGVVKERHVAAGQAVHVDHVIAVEILGRLQDSRQCHLQSGAYTRPFPAEVTSYRDILDISSDDSGSG
jgi:hypothetical protein